MKTAAIICEYNPFHNGHKYQIDYVKNNTDADAVVCLMSGSLVQRGEFAIFDKKVRAKAAILSGADLVLENPSFCVLRSAEGYAYSSVYTLSMLNSIDYLVFGAEDDIDVLLPIARLLLNELEEFKISLLRHLNKGLSFASARGQAIADVLGNEFCEIIKKPNNILGIEYLKALLKLNSKIQPVVVKRIGVEHNEKEAFENYASASFIRENINNPDVKNYVPKEVYSLYKGASFCESKLDNAIISSLILKSLDELKNVDGISEGLENKIKDAALKARTLDELINNVKSKRYAYSRIKRAIFSSYLGIYRDDIDELPKYIKIIDFNERGQAFLNFAKKASDIKICKNATPLLKDVDAMKKWKKELEIDKVYELYCK